MKGWINLYHISTDRMIIVKPVNSAPVKNRIEKYYVDQERNLYTEREFYPWKRTE